MLGDDLLYCQIQRYIVWIQTFFWEFEKRVLALININQIIVHNPASNFRGSIRHSTPIHHNISYCIEVIYTNDIIRIQFSKKWHPGGQEWRGVGRYSQQALINVPARGCHKEPQLRGDQTFTKQCKIQWYNNNQYQQRINADEKCSIVMSISGMLI